MVESLERGRARLSEAQRALLEKRLREGAESARARAARIPKRPAAESAPLSFAQQRLWMLHDLDGGGSAYNVPVAFDLRGPLDIPALRSALREMVRRHESLRTRFAERGGDAVQVVDEDLELDLPVVDLVPIPEVTRGEEARRLIRNESERPFDLESGPVLRVSLFRVEADRQILLWVAHHIVSDGWSLGVLTRELAALYRAFHERLPSPLEELPVQYADFAVWQREWFRGERLEAQIQYWREALEGMEALNLPLDRPRPAIASFEGASLRLGLPLALVERLRELGRSENASLYMVLLAAFQVLLHRYSGQEDIVVGSPIANRNRTEIEGLVGFFVNSLVMRCDLSGRPSFREALRRVRAGALAAFAHQDLPFEKLVEELRPERKLSQNPLFQVMFVLQNAPIGSFELPEIKLAPFELDVTRTRFDLELHLWEQRVGLLAVAFYNTDLFDRETIERLLGHFRSVLEEGVARPDVRISDLSMLGSDERRRLVAEWNDTVVPLPERSVTEQFEARVKERPSGLAAICGEEQITYGELNRRANQLAHRLRKEGVSAETLVGICAERSIEALVGFVGIVKSGGAYVPLDPSYPAERLRWMVDDLSVKVVVSERKLEELVAGMGATVVSLEEGSLSLEPTSNPESWSRPENLAYVIYTSGSTGRPKGVGIPHRAIQRLIWKTNYVELRAEDRMAMASNLSFDAATFEIWGALSRGASLVVIPREVALSPGEYTKELSRSSVTMVFLTTALFNQLARERVEAFRGLKQVLFGGEAVDPVWVRRVLEEGGPGRLLHVYGPTETTTFASWHEVTKVDQGACTVPIGVPLTNTQLYVLDADMSPMPVGVPGELYIGGAGVARGYVNRPELTGEKFVPDPFGGEAGARLYRTGDLVRWSGEGKLEFLGRVDHQVKVRGFRVEPSEIESAMLGFPGVRDAVVVARESEADATGSKRLVGYVVSEPQGRVEEDAGGELQREQVTRWRKTYDEVIYGEMETGAETPTFNIAGWNSSYSGKPLSAEAMGEQVEQTVSRILSVGPERVLEIGCGTGLLLFRIAPHCRKYVGTDFSPVALGYVREHLDALGEKSSVVELSERLANDFRGIEPGSFDVVALNSTIQYFPSVSYLLEVLEGAVRSVRDGGHVFLGDVRHFGLLEAFHTAVVLSQWEGGTTTERLWTRVRQRVEQEQELLVSPALFRSLGSRMERVKGVRIQPKRGREVNELTEFRYDVFLQVGGEPRLLPDVEWQEWGASGFSLEGLERRLSEERPEVLGLSGIPNRRVWKWVEARRLLSGSARDRDELNEVLSRSNEGVDPEAIWRLSERHPYRVEVSWLSNREDGSYEAILVREDQSDWEGALGWFPEGALEVERASEWTELGNEPWKGGLTRGLVPRLREHLMGKLPEYMVPSVLVLLSELPLNPNGKVDREKLPSPESARPELAVGYVAPRGPVEEGMSDIWSDVLGVEQIGVHDDFFELGGHSLLATQVMSRVRHAFQVEVPLRSLFESPTVAGLSETVAAARSRGDGEAPSEPMSRVRRDGALPASYAQQRLWLLDRLEPANPAYAMWHAFRLQGRVDETALERSLREVVRRHESLRTTFVEIDGAPQQRVGSEKGLVLERRDLRGVDEPAINAQREEAARGLVREFTRRPFDLAEGPLFRASSIRMGDEDVVLVLSMHHVVSDGWSKGVLMRELSTLYDAFRKGMASPLAELPIQYVDYAVWQRDFLQGPALTAELDYWREKLSGAPPSLDLPLDRPRPKRQTHRGGQLARPMSEELTSSLRELSRKSGVTTFMTLLAALKVLLSRYSGQTDVCVGTPIANRNRRETEGLIGFFLNTLVLRTDLSGEPSFEEVLSRVREVCLSAYGHQNVPFEKLLSELHPERDLGRTPLFQVFFNMLTFEESNLELRELEVRPYPTEAESAKFDLTLYVLERSGRLVVVASYNRDVLDEKTVARWLGHYERLLEQCASRPREKVSRYDLRVAEDREKLPEPSDEIVEGELETVLERMEKLTLSAPEAVAIRQGERELTYRELSRRICAAASRLVDDGLRKGDVVALRGSRSIELVVAMCAAMRAGGVALLLDESLPEERQRVMVSEAKAAVVLSVSEGDWESDGGGGDGVEVRAEDPAYLFFTSGTTGPPKGILGTHKGLSHFVTWERESFGIGPNDRVAQLTSLSFDAVLRDVFLPLASGGCLVIPDDGTDLGADRLLRWLAREQITVLHTIPALAATWLAAAPENVSLPSLRWVLFSGEALPWSLVRKWREAIRGGRHRIVSLYGPTETTMTKCFFVVPEECPEEGVVPLGEPMPATQALILGRDGIRLGIGEVGEIVIRTPYRTLGYVNASEEQNARFRPNPYRAKGDGERDLLYYTGDLGRLRGDLTLQYLGRMDGQLKIRGARVEPAEVEQALNGHPSVAQSVVAGRNLNGETALVAYVVPREGTAFDASSVKSHLRERLPEYLVPQSFHEMAALPRTPSGKIDRKALPHPSPAESRAASALRVPRNATEQKLATIMAEVLGRAEVSIEDDFFDLGGHSLLATQYVSRLREAFGVNVPLKAVFEHPTVAGLSLVVEEAMRSGARDEVRPIVALPRGRRGSRPVETEALAGSEQVTDGG